MKVTVLVGGVGGARFLLGVQRLLGLGQFSAARTSRVDHELTAVVNIGDDAWMHGALVIASALRWPACHGYTHIQSGTQWTVAPISDADGALSTIATQQNARAGGWACGRALVRKNNVIIDVNTCSPDPKNSAVDIANQIAAKVSTR